MVRPGYSAAHIRESGQATVASSRAQLAEQLCVVRPPGRRLALVPTLGALHAGHGELFDIARQEADVVVVSVFVNPLQFGAGEDYGRYPRHLDADVDLCASHGVDVVFAPTAEGMYPVGDPAVTVDPGPLGDLLEGASRPGHFRGVLTVVTKLFAMTAPDLAIFGEKDYQQLALIRRLAADLSLSVNVVAAPTRREPDGLALSSRNRYLSAGQRQAAVALSAALRSGAAAAPAGREAVLGAAYDVISSEPQLTLDYLVLLTDDLATEAVTGPARLLVAADLGGTRLIDNAAVTLP